MKRIFLALFCVLFTGFGCDQGGQGPTESSSSEVSSETTASPTKSCPVSTPVLLPDGTDLASLFEMKSGVLHLKVPVTIEVGDSQTALTLRGGQIGLDVLAVEIGVRTSGGVGLRALTTSANGCAVEGVNTAGGAGGPGVCGQCAGGNCDAVVGRNTGNGTAFRGFGSTEFSGSGADSGWISCPENDECACPSGMFITKTRNRGAEVFCSKL